jgi:hypothetical protein
MELVPGMVVVFRKTDKWMHEYSLATLDSRWAWDGGNSEILDGSLFMVMETQDSGGGYVRVLGSGNRRFMIPLKYLRSI